MSPASTPSTPLSPFTPPPSAASVITQAWIEGLTPPPTQSVAEWADLYRWVAPPSPETGWWRNSRTPYLVGIMETISPIHPAREIDLMKATQMGGSECLVNSVGFYSHLAPTTGMIVLPTKDVAEEWSKIRFEQLFDTTPILAGLLQTPRARHNVNQKNTTFSKRLTGGRGNWKMAWSSSGRVLRSTPAEILIADEVDDFDIEVRGQGEPIELLRKRFQNYPRGKLILCSSPTTRSHSRIESAFLKGDQRLLFIPCPNCSHYQRLIFSNLHSDPLGPYFPCIACDYHIRETQKNRFMPKCRWVACKDLNDPTGKSQLDIANTGFSTTFDLSPITLEMSRSLHASFHLPSFYAPYGWYGASWTATLKAWEEMKGEPNKKRVFVNTVLGETWQDETESMDWEKLWAKREDYTLGIVPDGGLLLTAACDVHADRLEVEVRAWGRGKQSWSMWYEIMPGSPDDPETWVQLDQLLAQDWPHTSGAFLPITLLVIDSGYRSECVYNFCRRHRQLSHGPAGSRATHFRSVSAVRGDPHDSGKKLINSITSVDTAQKRTGVRVVTIGTGYAKTEIYSRFRLQSTTSTNPDGSTTVAYPSGYCHLPNYPDVYGIPFFQGLVSESKIVKKTGRVEWVVEPGVRNEPLDLAVYNLAAAHLCGIDSYREEHWRELEAMVARRALEQENSYKKPVVEEKAEEEVEGEEEAVATDLDPTLEPAPAPTPRPPGPQPQPPARLSPPIPTPPPPTRLIPPTPLARPRMIRGRFKF